MAYNFPDNPTPGQVFQKWTWDGIAWVLTAPSNYTKAEADAKFVDVAGDTMTGHLTLPTGPGPSNAVRKDYVDGAVASVDLSSKVSKSGDTMSGGLTVAGELVAGAAYIRMGTAGTGGYFQWGGGISYNCGGQTIYHSGNFNPASYLPLSGGAMTGAIGTPVSGSIVTAGPVPTITINGAQGDWACMSFLSANVLGANFGMHPNGNFYFGGWSFGGAAYQFWSSRDFAAPNFAPYVSNGRLAFAADTAIALNGAMTEPYGGAVVTGQGGASLMRFRYMQLLTTGWFTIGYA